MTTLSRRGFLLSAAATLAGCAAYEPQPSYPPIYGRPVYYPGPYAYGYGYGYNDRYHRRRHDRRRHDDDDRRGHRDDDDRRPGRGDGRDDDRKPDRKPPKRRAERGPTDEELLMRLNGSRNREGVLRRLGRSDLIAR